jgi:hypothetical protein
VILVATLAVIPVMVIELETSSSGWRPSFFVLSAHEAAGSRA